MPDEQGVACSKISRLNPLNQRATEKLFKISSSFQSIHICNFCHLKIWKDVFLPSPDRAMAIQWRFSSPLFSLSSLKVDNLYTTIYGLSHCNNLKFIHKGWMLSTILCFNVGLLFLLSLFLSACIKERDANVCT